MTAPRLLEKVRAHLRQPAVKRIISHDRDPMNGPCLPCFGDEWTASKPYPRWRRSA